VMAVISAYLGEINAELSVLGAILRHVLRSTGLSIGMSGAGTFFVQLVEHVLKSISAHVSP